MVRGGDELLFDADVLIDFCSVDPGIIRTISEHLGTAHVAREVLREVDALDEIRCSNLKLHIESPTDEEIDAALILKEPLSFADKVTLVMARQRGWVCITNDQKLRKCCSIRHTATRRGLSLLRDLVAAGSLTKSDATNMVREIGRVSRISPAVIKKILDAINGVRED